MEKGEQTAEERKKVEDELRIDALTAGTSIARVREDGSIERIAPEEYFKRPAKKSDA